MDDTAPSNFSDSVSTARPPLEWEAREYVYVEKGSDWYWVLGLLAVAGIVAALLFNNVLFAILILVAAFTLALVAGREPKLVHFTLTQRGVRIDGTLYPFGNLKSFAITERSANHTPTLIIEPKALFSSHIYIPLEHVDVDHVHDFLLDFLKEEDHEEPIVFHLMEWLGF